MKYVYTALYIFVIVFANWLVDTFGLIGLGLGLVVPAGTFAAGAALVIRDGLNLYVGRVWMLCAIAAGALVSVVTSNPALAVASGIAFAVSELVDWGVFTPLRNKSLPTAVVVSSIVSSPVDTVLFLHLAGLGVSWSAVLGQFLVKTAIALLVAAGLTLRDRKALATS